MHTRSCKKIIENIDVLFHFCKLFYSPNVHVTLYSPIASFAIICIAPLLVIKQRA